MLSLNNFQPSTDFLVVVCPNGHISVRPELTAVHRLGIPTAAVLQAKPASPFQKTMGQLWAAALMEQAVGERLDCVILLPDTRAVTMKMVVAAFLGTHARVLDVSRLPFLS